jgi:esterase/lipase
VENGFAIVSSLCRHVVVGGFSAGAGLALELASRNPGISGVFAVCPPMRLQNPLYRIAPGIDTLKKSLQKVRLGGAVKSFVDNHPENPGINYTRNPISGVHELDRLMEKVGSRLPMIGMPTLVIQSEGDPVVDPRGSKELFEKIASNEKTYRTFDLNRHGILLGEGSDAVHAVIGEFCKRVYKSLPTRQ